MPGPETTTQQTTTDWQAKDAEIVASRPAIGSTTLDLFEGNLGRHAARVDDTPAPAPSAYEMGVDALALLFTPGLPKRARLVGLLAAGGAAAGMKLAWDLADQRARDHALTSD